MVEVGYQSKLLIGAMSLKSQPAPTKESYLFHAWYSIVT